MERRQRTPYRGMKLSPVLLVLLSLWVSLCHGRGIAAAQDGPQDKVLLREVSDPTPEPSCPPTVLTLSGNTVSRSKCRRRRIQISFTVSIDVGPCGNVSFVVTDRCRRRRSARRRARRRRRCLTRTAQDCDSLSFASREGCGIQTALACVRPAQITVINRGDGLPGGPLR